MADVIIIFSIKTNRLHSFDGTSFQVSIYIFLWNEAYTHRYIYYKRYHFRELIFLFIFRTLTRSTLIMKMMFVPFILAMFLAHFHSADGRISLGNRMFGGAKFGPAKKEQGKSFSGQHFSGICVYRYTKFCFCILKISFL